jgi:hypothetical protein
MDDLRSDVWHTGSGVDTATCLMSPRIKWLGFKADYSPHLLLRIRTRGAIPANFKVEQSSFGLLHL